MLVETAKQKMEENLPRRRPRSASCVALRQAVSQLTRLSDFKTEKIGGGFFADVYKVEHTNTGEVMVLKMNKHRTNSRQMLSEIQLLNRLSHPNILGFRGSCVHEGQLHALTEYINGGTLEELLQHHDMDLSWSVKTKIAKDIAEGMTYLHSKGIFHRDLTSRNCLIQHEPNSTLRAVVADFGLAAKIKDARGRNHTETVGSPYWMAPECLNGKEYCEKADVFSYGIILAEMLAQIPADPDFMPRTKQYGMDYDILQKLCVGCPEGLWDVMCKCSQIDPNARPTFVTVVLSLIKVCPDDDIRSCQSEPAILRDLEDSYSSDRVQDVVLAGSGSSRHRWSASDLNGQDLADTVHPPMITPEVAMNDHACAGDEQCKMHHHHHHHHHHPAYMPQAGQDVRTGVAAEMSMPRCRQEEPAELKEQVGSEGDCTPVVCPSPTMEGRRFGGRTWRNSCVTVQGGGLSMARVQTAPELSKVISHAPLLSFTEQADHGIFVEGGGVASLLCTTSTAPLMSDSSSLSSPEHAPCSPWVAFNTADTPLGIFTSPLPPKNFRFSLELSAGCQGPVNMTEDSLLSKRFDLISSDYGSGEIGSHSQNSTPMFCDDMRLCSLSLDARLKSHSAPSIKLPRRQSLNHSRSLRSWSSDSSRSSVSSFKCFDIRLRKNGVFSSTPNFLSTCLQTST